MEGKDDGNEEENIYFYDGISAVSLSSSDNFQDQCYYR